MSSAPAQRVALLTPDDVPASRKYAENLAERLAEKLTVVDTSLAEAAYRSAIPTAPFNMTSEESKTLASTIGCDFFVLVKAVNQRRSSFQREQYYESYAVVYLVSGRSGRLALWRLPTFDAERRDEAERRLGQSASGLATAIAAETRETTRREIADLDIPPLEPVPDEGTPAAKDLRPPAPYRRLKPEYTAQASFYDVTATVDIEVDLGADGVILRTRILRWAGYGLDESVEKTVRTMNWRAAMRGGKPLPMRFLLRYNFKKIEKESQQQ